MIHKTSKDIFYHSKPPHAPLKHGGAVYLLAYASHSHANNFFLYLSKDQITPNTK